MMAKFRLGDRVRVRARLVRDDGAWQRVECQHFDGIVTGYRNRNQGGWESEEDEIGRTSRWWAFGDQFQAMIITTDLYRRPEHCLEIDVALVQEHFDTVEWGVYIAHPIVKTVVPEAVEWHTKLPALDTWLLAP